jgi:hypothetical protein
VKTVADAHDGDAKLKDGGVDTGRVGIVGRVGRAGEDDAWRSERKREDQAPRRKTRRARERRDVPLGFQESSAIFCVHGRSSQ